LGRNEAADVKGKVKVPDVIRLADRVGKAKVDKEWLFIKERVSDAVKAKAKEFNISMFDSSAINEFKSGAKFTSRLKKYKEC
jgi:hypothetical protein